MKQPAIRHLYEAHGADGYYRDHADTYDNPHFPEIAALLSRNTAHFPANLPILDFAAGGGEVSIVLTQLGYTQLSGCDPYTADLYRKKTALPCLELSFRDVIKTGLAERYGLIISSFALHLCPEKDLFPLVWQLFQSAPLLLVITPHKRPALEQIPGVQLVLEDAVLTPRGKQVRLKGYRYNPG